MFFTLFRWKKFLDEMAKEDNEADEDDDVFRQDSAGHSKALADSQQLKKPPAKVVKQNSVSPLRATSSVFSDDEDTRSNGRMSVSGSSSQLVEPYKAGEVEERTDEQDEQDQDEIEMDRELNHIATRLKEIYREIRDLTDRQVCARSPPSDASNCSFRQSCWRSISIVGCVASRRR